MKKFMKHALTLCLALCGVIALFGLTACTPEPQPETKDFTVCVQYEDGKGVQGVWASWCVMGDDSGVCIDPNDGADANGIVTLKESAIMSGNFADKNFHVKLTNLPDGYTYQQDADGYYNGEGYIISANNRAVTIVLTKAN